MGAFKFRGAFNALSKFDAAQRKAGAIAFSSGNHAQAVALSARMLGMPAVIVMPQDAPAAKLAATRGYGAEVVLYDRFTEDREALTKALADRARHDADPALRPPRRDRGPGHGRQGTVRGSRRAGPPLHLPGRRRADQRLGAGRARAGAAVARSTASSPEAGDDGLQSLRAGHIVRIATPKTIADGAQTQYLGDYTFGIIRRDVDDILTVSDAQLVDAMRFSPNA